MAGVASFMLVSLTCLQVVQALMNVAKLTDQIGLFLFNAVSSLRPLRDDSELGSLGFICCRWHRH